MIVSHEHKFIFVHLKRTSGRAIQSALVPFLGPDDIATPQLAQTEDADRPMFPGRNCEGLRRHLTARQIRQHVGEDVWNEYFTFVMERNPWDKILSRYWSYVKRDDKPYHRVYRKIRGNEMTLEHWLHLRRLRGGLLGKRHYHLPCHHRCYTDQDGEVMVDFIARFENRADHLSEIGRRIGLPIDPDVRVGTKVRRKRSTDYTEFFDRPWMRELIDKVFAPDLALLGYRFGEPHPTDWIERTPASAR